MHRPSRVAVTRKPCVRPESTTTWKASEESCSSEPSSLLHICQTLVDGYGSRAVGAQSCLGEALGATLVLSSVACAPPAKMSVSIPSPRASQWRLP